MRDDGFDLGRLQPALGFDKVKALKEVKELINTNDETRKRFEISARAVFRKYKSCLTFAGAENYKPAYQAINYIYQSLQEDKVNADNSDIIQKLNKIVSEAIDVKADVQEDRIFDISKINFELLKKEFAKSKRKASDVQDLRTVLQRRLAKMLAQNPTLLNFQERFDKIVVGYNKEKDKNTIETTFEALITLTGDMEAEEQSHVALGLSKEEKPVFDLLIQADMTKVEIKQIKSASVELLQAIEARIREVQGVFQKSSTRDGLRVEIYDLLYDERTGLPATKFDDEAIELKTDAIFKYFESQTALAA